jgi:OmpA-OmpF porin, OOP family
MKLNRVILIAMIISPGLLPGQIKRPVQAPTFGVHFLYNDFKTAAAIRSSSLSSVIRNKEFAKISEMSPGIALNYLQGLSGTFDISAMLSGSFPDYPGQDGSLLGENSLLVETDISIRGKMFSENYWVSPYLQLGLGLSKYKNYWGAYIPAGMGIQVNLPSEFFVMVNAQYRAAVTEKTVSPHLFYSVGIAGVIRRKPKPVVQPVPIPVLPPIIVTDRDGDGIVDTADACPDQAGMAWFNGCPDRDIDSVPDHSDKCPSVYGLVALEGCPAPDTVKAEVVVKEDVEKIITTAAENIFFATAKYDLLPASFAALDTVVAIMKREPPLKLVIEGHTDNVGDSAKNKILSERRARAVYEYMAKRGIDISRLSSVGYGEERPRAGNESDEGRRRNRRVEMRLGE